ncbi:putative POX domain-containing protein [Lupinus albus]|uniref:Putative POX domain-containing protein n=1 Tax=Lupinus albus TaxID=3870 RepID=A0A6A4NN06_LUPAL|nr:putative POX domain-containing protein [Lupinus albus]
MSSTRPESHVAQQIRRDKLRIQDSSHNHLQEFHNNNPGQLSSHQGFNLDQVRNVRNANILVVEPVTEYSSSEMANFSNPLSTPRNNNTLQCQELGEDEPAIKVMMHQFPSSSISLGNWRNSATHQGVDWNVLNYASSSMSSESNQNSFLASEINNNVSVNYQHFGKPSYNELTETQPSSLSREIQKKLGVNVMHHQTSSSYQNALQDIVKSSASISSACNGSDMASLMQQTGQNIWVGDANELAQLHPSYSNQQNRQSHFTCGNLWTNRPLPSDSTPQSLSLSLSSNSQSKPFVSHFEEASASASAFASDHCISKEPPKHVKPSIISRDCGKSPLQDYVGILPNSNNTSYRNVGPLGPFTGYATILKSSRFLNSAQQLLEDFCCVSDSRFANVFDVPNRVSEEISASTSADDVTVIETRGVAPKGGNLGSSSSMLYSANENITDRGTWSSFGLSPTPDYQQKKAKLLYMQEEVGFHCSYINIYNYLQFYVLLIIVSVITYCCEVKDKCFFLIPLLCDCAYCIVHLYLES